MFVYFIQYGGDPHDKYENLGTTDFSHFIEVFDKFPWIEEIGKANKKPYGSSPTLSVKNTEDDKDLWVSMSGNQQRHGYLLGYVHTMVKRKWLGFRKTKSVRWLEIYLTRDMLTVKHYFKLYFAGEYDELQADIRTLERFTALETHN